MNQYRRKKILILINFQVRRIISLILSIDFITYSFNNLLTTPPLYSGENKRPPKNIKKDKEKLYEEVLDVK